MEVVNQYFCKFNVLPSYEHFYQNVMRQNKACIFNEQLTVNWKSRQKWALESGKPNLEYLQKHYGTYNCPVYNCSKTYYDSNPQESMPLWRFVQYWQELIEHNHDYKSRDVLYLKDWHFFQDTGDTECYQVPPYFESDYLNEYCLHEQIVDYRFVYMGPKGSSTPLHIDVFGSFSWSANVCGLKKWLIIPDCNVDKLKQLVRPLVNDLYSLPNHKDIFKQVGAFEVVQHPGEVIFVPSGYMHQVVNEEDTISINHNWFNACNINRICDNILEANSQVCQQIADLQHILNAEEWRENCSKILAMHFGIELADFISIVEHVAHRLKKESSQIESLFRFQHDLTTIREVTLKMKSCAEFAYHTQQLDVIVALVDSVQTKFILS